MSKIEESIKNAIKGVDDFMKDTPEYKRRHLQWVYGWRKRHDEEYKKYRREYMREYRKTHKPDRAKERERNRRWRERKKAMKEAS